MIFSIGYQRLTVPRLQAIIDATGAQLLDCRSSPSSRRPGFHGTALRRVFGARYTHRPDLGGRIVIAPEAIASLVAPPTVLLLMCREEAPGECHRHFAIAVPLLDVHGVDVTHLYQDHAVLASELQRAFDEDTDEYQPVDLPAAVLAALG